MLRALNLVSVMNTMRRGLELEVLPSLTPLSEEGRSLCRRALWLEPTCGVCAHAGTYIWRDVPYVGPDSSAPAQRAPTAHDKHCVDVFIPDKPFPRPALPVALFVHGGAWQRGDRQSRLNTYGNVGIACARAGIVGVVMSYRLAPEVRARTARGPRFAARVGTDTTNGVAVPTPGPGSRRRICGGVGAAKHPPVRRGRRQPVPVWPQRRCALGNARCRPAAVRGRHAGAGRCWSVLVGAV